MEIIIPPPPPVVQTVSGVLTVQKIIALPVWNMAADIRISVAHGVNWTKILSVGGFIWDDSQTRMHPIAGNGNRGVPGTSQPEMGFSCQSIDATNLVLRRIEGNGTEINTLAEFTNLATSRGRVFLIYEQ